MDLVIILLIIVAVIAAMYYSVVSTLELVRDAFRVIWGKFKVLTHLTLLVTPLSGRVKPLESRDPRRSRFIAIEPSDDANEIDGGSNAHVLPMGLDDLIRMPS